MDINTFFKNGDPSYPTLGFDGGFKAIPINRFSDETYFEATGNILVPPTTLSGRSKEAYKGVFSAWRPSYSTNCEKINEFISIANNRLSSTNDKIAKGDKVAQDYVAGYEAAITKLKELSLTAKCDLAQGGDLTNDVTNTTNEGISTGGWIAIIGSSALVLGLVGYFLYKKYKK
jgi:hypothetical protein